MAGKLLAGSTNVNSDANKTKATIELPRVQPAADSAALLELRDLQTYFRLRRTRSDSWLKAVDGVSLAITKGETFGLVGESGCGKSTLVRTILQLEKAHAGQVFFEGNDILGMRGRQLRSTQRQIQVVFQDPRASLDPRMTAGDIIGEGLVVQGTLSRRDRRRRVEELGSSVGLRKEHLDRYPHEFSGGQQQRIGIARALALRPKLIVADEPVSALDVSVQSQVLNLLADLQEELGLTYLFIAHDLGVVKHISNRVAVMYLGKIVELASTDQVFGDPKMPYTQALLSAIPKLRASERRERILLDGDPPSPTSIPSGCPFRTRCWKAAEICEQSAPALREVSAGHWAACHFAESS